MQKRRRARSQGFTSAIDGGDRQNLCARLRCKLATQPETGTSGDEEVDDHQVGRSFLEKQGCLGGIERDTDVVALCSEEVLSQIGGIRVSLREEDQRPKRRTRFPYGR